MDLKRFKQINVFADKDGRNTLVFLTLSFIVLFFVYDYHSIIIKPPQSVHSWRQSDCASQALNYAERNSDFFRPQIHGLISQDYQSGYCMEEFPVIFYVVGMLYNVFGNIDFIFRTINLLIFLTGLYFLFRFQHKILNSNFWSYGYTILLFTSPVIVFYANNYLLNTPAFALTLIGWYFFYRYLESTKHKHLLISFILFTLGPLLKLSELISVFTIVGIIFLDYFKIVTFKNKGNKLFKNPFTVAAYSLIAILIVFAWYYYSHYYNAIHEQTYYIYTIRDIFSLSPEARKDIYEIISNYWGKYYQNKIVLYFFAATYLINLVFIKKVNTLLMAITSIMFIGSVLFVLLFFYYLRNHDYYIISLYITTVFSTITFTDLLLRRYSRIINSPISKLVFIALLIYSIHYTNQKMNIRYMGWENYVYLTERNDIYYIKPYLTDLGIPYDAMIISIPDFTPNLTLYLMNRRGWTNFQQSDNALLVEMAVERGADYLVINDPRLLSENDLKPFLYHKVGEFRNTSIFKLDGIANDSFYKRRRFETIRWDMETLTSDSLFVISDTLEYKIPNRHISRDFSFSGQQSLQVKPGDFALNYIEDNVIEYQKYLIQLKKYSKKESTSPLIICISSPEEFYFPISQKSEIVSSEWKQIEFQFTVPSGLKNNKLSIDFLNTDEFDIYLDDFTITKIKDN